MEMKERKQWLVWRLQGERKRCCNRWGEYCGSTDTHYYMTWDEAKAVCERLNVQGPAFCFTADDPYVGIDIDDSLIEYNQPKEWILPILERFKNTYLEVSPGLHGIKIYAKGKKPDGYGSCTLCEDGAIEVYEFGRFFTFSELDFYPCSQEVTDCQAEIDWLFSTYFQRGEKQASGVVLPVMSQMQACASLQYRVAKYMDSVERPAPGGRNNAAFRLAGHLRAFVDSDGEKLGDDDLRQWMLTWNQSLPDPLDTKEVLACLYSSERNGTPRDLKIGKPVVSIPVISFSSKTTSAREESLAIHCTSPSCNPLPEPGEEKQELKKAPASEFPAELLEVPGLVGAFVRYCEETCFLRQPVLALAAGLCLQGVLAGRKVIECFGNRPNIYCLGVAESGTGKEHARMLINRILGTAGGMSLAGLENPRSGSAMVREMVNAPAKLALIDELGRYLRFNKQVQTNGHQAEMIDYLLKLYSAGEGVWYGAQFADQKMRIEIDRPSLSLYGTSVPGNLWENMTRDSVTDGVLSRMLVFSGEDHPERGPMDPNRPVPQEILDHAKAWLNFGGGNLATTPVGQAEQVIPHTPDARQMASDVLSEAFSAMSLRGAEERALASRVGQNACKLALIYACSRDPHSPVIDVEAVQWAYKLAKHLKSEMIRVVEDRLIESPFHRRQQVVVQWLRDAGGTVSMTEFNRRFKNWEKRDRDSVIQNMLDTDQAMIERPDSSTCGRPRTIIKFLA